MKTQPCYMWINGAYLPESKSAWVKQDVECIEVGDKTKVVTGNANISLLADAMILADGTVIRFDQLPDTYLDKTVDSTTLSMLEELHIEAKVDFSKLGDRAENNDDLNSVIKLMLPKGQPLPSDLSGGFVAGK